MEEIPCRFRYSSIFSSSMESTVTLLHSFWNSVPKRHQLFYNTFLQTTASWWSKSRLQCYLLWIQMSTSEMSSWNKSGQNIHVWDTVQGRAWRQNCTHAAPDSGAVSRGQQIRATAMEPPCFSGEESRRHPPLIPLFGANSLVPAQLP